MSMNFDGLGSLKKRIEHNKNKIDENGKVKQVYHRNGGTVH